MRLIFHPAARKEIEETVSFYEDRAIGLGADFLSEVVAGTEHLLRYPEAGFSVTAKLRRHVLKRFPYSLLYHVREDVLEVAAVMHHRRRPEYWKNRL